MNNAPGCKRRSFKGNAATNITFIHVLGKRVHIRIYSRHLSPDGCHFHCKLLFSLDFPQKHQQPISTYWWLCFQLDHEANLRPWSPKPIEEISETMNTSWIFFQLNQSNNKRSSIVINMLVKGMCSSPDFYLHRGIRITPLPGLLVAPLNQCTFHLHLTSPHFFYNL